mmetsp:Transcript_10621/g.12173  ORF Transcript_10621/g.12173 Transcript_10621/m.12173 type:complete len:399 (-) Transcript_10621:47-1243(-)
MILSSNNLNKLPSSIATWFKVCILIILCRNSVLSFIHPLQTTMTEGLLAKKAIGSCSNFSCNRSRLLLFSTAKQEQEIQIHENRTESTQNCLREKTTEIKFLHNKISVLQDVLIKKKEKQKEEFEKALEQKEYEYQSKLNNIHEEIEKRIEDAISRQKKEAVDRLQHEIEKKEDFQKATTKLKHQVTTLKNEVVDMDETIETMQEKVRELEVLLAVREKKICDLEEEALKNSELVLAQRSAADEKENNRKEIQSLEKEILSARSHSDKTEIMRQDTIKIAESTVRAAEKREKKLTYKVMQLEEEVQIKFNYSEQLRREVSQIKEYLKDEETSNVNTRKAEQERFATELDSEQQKHQMELEKLQSKLIQERKRSNEVPSSRERRRTLWKRFRGIFMRKN